MSAESREGRREVRLTPPPRVESAPSGAARIAWAPEHSAGDGGQVLKWLTVLGLVVLAGVAVGVFVVLPDWAEQQREASSGLEATQVERSMGSPPHPSPLPQGGEGAGVEVASTVSAPQSERGRVEDTPEAPDPRLKESRVVAIEAGRDEPDAFAQAMTQGLAALERDDFAAAQTAFEQARALDPDSPQPVDGMARAEAGLRRTLIGELRGQAMVLEVREDWRDALEHYEKVLAIDPTVLFAQEGRERTLERAELADALAYHLSSPERLSTEAVLQEVSVLVARAGEVEPSGPRHERQVEELGRLVKAYSTPIRARLRSDNLTEVVVYKVGRLGAFSEQQLELRPGTYTVVGSREGYRDVRRRLVVEPGSQPEPLDVRCEERI